QHQNIGRSRSLPDCFYQRYAVDGHVCANPPWPDARPVRKRRARSQIDVPGSSAGRVVAPRRFGLADFPVANPRIPALSLHCGPWPPRIRRADRVAPRVRRERRTVEGAGQRRGDVDLEMKIAAAALVLASGAWLIGESADSVGPFAE